MLAHVHGAERHDAMHVVGSGHTDDIDTLTHGLEHLPPIGEGFYSGSLCRKLLAFAGIHIGCRNHMNLLVP